ncbi:MAG: TRL-like family protein [Candidatus Omnitrophota bacterium]|nr:TRL-like family protein [Candidatus Omnitrophota bacterium]
MFKSFCSLVLVCVMAFSVTGCASYLPTGCLYTEVTAPISVASTDVSYTKVGVSKSTSIFGLVATGDASLKAAMDNGGIKKIKHVEYSVKNILGFGENKTIVYGD